MRKILVIESHQCLREDIHDILGFENYDAVMADDGATGIELAREHVPDMILCEVKLPELDGFGLYDQLQGDPKTASIPFIFMLARDVAKNKPELKQRLREFGPDNFLVKPFNPLEMLMVIKAQLKRQDMLRWYQETEVR